MSNLKNRLSQCIITNNMKIRRNETSRNEIVRWANNNGKHNRNEHLRSDFWVNLTCSFHSFGWSLEMLILHFKLSHGFLLLSSDICFPLHPWRFFSLTFSWIRTWIRDLLHQRIFSPKIMLIFFSGVCYCGKVNNIRAFKNVSWWISILWINFQGVTSK